MYKSLSHAQFAAARPQAGLLQKLFYGLETYRQHRALQKLDAHLLQDLGLSKADVAAESSKSIWAASTAVCK